MPKLPNEVKTSIQVPNMPQATPGMMGVDLGTATQQMGQMTAKVGQQAQEVGFSLLKAYDEAVVTQTYNDAVNKMTELDEMVRSTQGTQAVEAQKEWVEKVDNMQSEAVKDMTPAQRSLFDLNFGKAKRTHQTYIGTHVAKEVISAKVNSIKMAAQTSVKEYENGTPVPEKQMIEQLTSYGYTLGYRGTDLEMYVSGAVLKARGNRYANLVKNGQINSALALAPGNYSKIGLPVSSDLAKNWQNPNSLVTASFTELGHAKYFTFAPQGLEGEPMVVQGFYQDPTTGELKEYANVREAVDANAPSVLTGSESEAKKMIEVLSSQEERESFLVFDKGQLSASLNKVEQEKRAYITQVEKDVTQSAYVAVSKTGELPSTDEVAATLGVSPELVAPVIDRLHKDLVSLQNELQAEGMSAAKLSDINAEIVKRVDEFKQGEVSVYELTKIQQQLNILSKDNWNVSALKSLVDDTVEAYNSGKITLSESSVIDFKSRMVEIFNDHRGNVKVTTTDKGISIKGKKGHNQDMVVLTGYIEQYEDYIHTLEEKKGGVLTRDEYVYARNKFMEDFERELTGKAVAWPWENNYSEFEGLFGTSDIDKTEGLWGLGENKGPAPFAGPPPANNNDDDIITRTSKFLNGLNW